MRLLYIVFSFFSFSVMGFAKFSYPNLDGFTVYLYAGLIAAPFFGGLGLLAARRGGRSSFRWAMNGIVMGGLMVGGLVELMNGKFDSSPAVVHQAKVLEKHEERHKRTVSHMVSLASWRPGHNTEKMRVSENEYAKVVPGTTMMEVKTHAGFFGIEWIESQNILSATKSS